MSYHRVTLSYLFLGRVLQNVMHFNNFDGLLTNQQIFDQVTSSWVSTWRPMQSNKIALFNVEVREVNTPNPSAAQNFATSMVGTGSTISAHGSLCLKLRFNTGLAGRKHRGRYYMPGISSGIVADDVIAASQDATLINLCASMTTRWCGSGIQGLALVIVHKNSGDVPTSVQQITYSRVLGIQRRRNVGVGI